MVSVLGPRTGDGESGLVGLCNLGDCFHSPRADSWLSLALLRKAFQVEVTPSSIERSAGSKVQS